MAKDIAWLQQNLAGQQPSVQIVNDSFFKYESHLVLQPHLRKSLS